MNASGSLKLLRRHATNSKIFVAGHRGLVGSAIKINLERKGYKNIITRTREELDLTDAVAVEAFFSNVKPDYVFLAAAKVGGILANNKYRANFMYENIMIQNNVIHHSYLHGVKKLLFLGSTCIYPKKCPQPMKEEYLLTGLLEYTNEPYAIAKIAGIKMCESYNLQYGTNFISVMPTNLYGPNDNFDLERSHVLPALIRKMHLGKALEQNDWEILRQDLFYRPIEGVSDRSSKNEIIEKLHKYGVQQTGGQVNIEIWGSGDPKREFLWSEDMADACIFLMMKKRFTNILEDIAFKEGRQIQKEVRNTHINIGTGKEVSIYDLAYLIKGITGFQGYLFFNKNKTDGTMRKLTDSSRLEHLGWKYQVGLTEGINRLYGWYSTKIPIEDSRTI
ncbi:GDP-L-fucose synthase [Zunongwangia sp. F260]|uniref:GDP-L-fucose synthase n=1 Tax=Autumnicola lenta TaxID=3075593 RepID=A0ABU3CIF3_9FLAO|nr:GDP-L-fucose synthase [Zunongwangia sp. F260]MDT0646076.1 GDP-L-fucose synthase [Zunongwangia sp. F260]